MKSLLHFISSRLTPYLSDLDHGIGITINEKQLDELTQKIQFLEKEWDRFSKSLKEISGCGRVMNRSALANPYSIMTEINFSTSQDSLLVLMSTLGDFYGFYFYSHTKKASQPVKLYKRKWSHQVENREWEDLHISYFPFSEDQREVMDQVEIRLEKSFPGFVRFDPDQAAIPVQDIRIGEEFYSRLDLFQVVFIYEPVCF